METNKGVNEMGALEIVLIVCGIIITMVVSFGVGMVVFDLYYQIRTKIKSGEYQ